MRCGTSVDGGAKRAELSALFLLVALLSYPTSPLSSRRRRLAVETGRAKQVAHLRGVLPAASRPGKLR